MLTNAEVELAALDGAERLDQLCELSIRQQVGNLSRTPIIQSAWKRRQPLRIHVWVYGLSDGLILDLEYGV